MINRHTAIGRRMLREMRRGRQEQPAEARGPSPMLEVLEQLRIVREAERRAYEWIEKMRCQVELNASYEGVTFKCDLLLDDSAPNFDGFTALGRQLAEEWMERVVMKILSEPESSFVTSSRTSLYDVPAELLHRERDRVVDEGTLLQDKPLGPHHSAAVDDNVDGQSAPPCVDPIRSASCW